MPAKHPQQLTPFQILLPRELLDHCTQKARQLGLSRSAWIRMLIIAATQGAQDAPTEQSRRKR